MSWLVLFFAIAIAFYVENTLIPLAPNEKLKVVFRWNYVNGVMMAIGPLHPLARVAQVLFILAMGIWAIRLSNEYLRIDEEIARQEQILREKEEAEREAREAERKRRQAERERLDMCEWLAQYGCPLRLDCQMMGADGEGGCENWKVCQKY